MEPGDDAREETVNPYQKLATMVFRIVGLFVIGQSALTLLVILFLRPAREMVDTALVGGLLGVVLGLLLYAVSRPLGRLVGSGFDVPGRPPAPAAAAPEIEEKPWEDQ